MRRDIRGRGQAGRSKIAFDVLHPAHLNFFLRTIRSLHAKYDLIVFVRRRGDLAEFAATEIGSIAEVKVLGKHRTTLLGKAFGVFERVSRLFVEYLRSPFDVALSHGGFYIAMVMWLVNRPSVIFYDNDQYRSLFLFCRVFVGSGPLPVPLGKIKEIRDSTTDLHTLMFHARCVLSTGDTVAREGALLGVPSFYLGSRDLPINRKLINRGRLFWPSSEEAGEAIEEVLTERVPEKTDEESDWEDTTEVIIRNIMIYVG